MVEEANIAIVTGTSAGIGAAVAEQLLEAGWTVIGMSRRQADFDAAGYRHIEVDLSDIEALLAIAAREIAPLLEQGRWQRVGLVNNAAVVGSVRYLEELEPAALQTVLAVNLMAPVWLMGFVARTAPTGAKLRIVNVSSGAALRPFPGTGDYGASKAALRLASMTFAAELSSDDRPGGPRRDASVISYSPGVVETEMQAMLRSRNLPWTQLFAEYHEQGRLQLPGAPAREIVGFLSRDDLESFIEDRFNDNA